MHHYPHHIGDFNNATRHLTRLERSIYRDLLDLCYDTEEPLPMDLKQICRLVLARDEQEVTAVEQVLNEFFIFDDGWTNLRATEIISDYQNSINNKKKAGKKSAKVRKLLKDKEKDGSTGVPTETQQMFNRSPTSVHNQEPRTKNQEPTTGQTKNQRFKPPKQDEIKAYFIEKGSTSDEAQRFHNYYESNGWKVGKNKMKKWQSAASNWISRNNNNQPQDSGEKELFL